MAEINKPDKRTFWRIISADQSVIHEGFTDPDQVTTSGLTIANSSVSAQSVYPPLPASGQLLKGKIYSYQNAMIVVEQTHERTIFEPSATPALFTVYRENTEGAAWIENEKVIAGDKRTYNNIVYKCLQGHTTGSHWFPNVTPALWILDVQPVLIPVWKQPTGGHDAYKIGDKVRFPTITDPIYQSKINSNVWSPLTYPAGWALVPN